MKRFFSFFFCLFAPLAMAGFFSPKPLYLPVNEAFPLEFSQQQNQLTLSWQITENYWLYQKLINIEAENAQIGHYSLPEAEDHEDPYFGKMKVYRRQLDLRIPLLQTGENPRLKITFQGCTDGLCYPPETKIFPLQHIVSTENAVPQNPQNNEEESITSRLSQSRWAMFGFFLLGLGLSFTPCVLPMLPLLSSLVIGQGKRPSMSKAFSLSFVYVQGMALTYTLLGLLVAAIGLPFQIALQSPPVLITLSVLFVILSLSMFGFYEIRLPNRLQNKLIALSNNQQSGAIFGVFVMGMLAGLIASPCTSAPLSGALLYVAQTGDLITGAISLYLLALGMGLPLMLVTLFGNQVLPKSGNWLNIVKTTFGFVMLAMPIILLSRLISEVWTFRLWGLLGTSYALWFALQLKGRGSATVIGKILSFLAAIILAYPLQLALWQTLSPQMVQPVQREQTSQWQKVATVEELQTRLAQNPQPFALVDFYADWCVACKELDEETFSNLKVQQALQNTLLIRVDVTENNPQNKALLEAYQILGLPAVLSFQGEKELFPLRLSGFENPQEFLQRLNKR